MPAGRPTSLTLEVRTAIIEALRAGNYIDTAIRIAGINRTTFYNWVKRAEAGESPFTEFINTCEKVIAEAEGDAVKSLQAAGKADWKAIAWWLSRRHFKKWGLKTTDDSGPKSPSGAEDSKGEA